MSDKVLTAFRDWCRIQSREIALAGMTQARAKTTNDLLIDAGLVIGIQTAQGKLEEMISAAAKEEEREI